MAGASHHLTKTLQAYQIYTSLSSRCATVFPAIIHSLLRKAPKIIYETFELQDMCCLLSGKDVKELTELLVQENHMVPDRKSVV